MWRERFRRYWARQVVESDIVNAHLGNVDDTNRNLLRSATSVGFLGHAMAFIHTAIKKLKKKRDA